MLCQGHTFTLMHFTRNRYTYSTAIRSLVVGVARSRRVLSSKFSAYRENSINHFNSSLLTWDTTIVGKADQLYLLNYRNQ